MQSTHFICFILLITVSACSKQHRPKTEPTVTIHISDDGLKRFQVTMSHHNDKPQKSNNKGGGRKGKRGGGRKPSKERSGRPSNKPPHLHKRVEQIMQKNGFCREGFVEIDQYSEAGTLYFNGQCNETASAVEIKHHKMK